MEADFRRLQFSVAELLWEESCSGTPSIFTVRQSWKKSHFELLWWLKQLNQVEEDMKSRVGVYYALGSTREDCNFTPTSELHRALPTSECVKGLPFELNSCNKNIGHPFQKYIPWIMRIRKATYGQLTRLSP
ncbi:hypothetical protein V6N13_065599 [Hibiscus sabdariffa]|uniref:Uncharacterized protein n=1 Tax=Hibiscus sabdariffa TaxID=183260 RepID=A0ABR2QQC8_9ROSI